MDLKNNSLIISDTFYSIYAAIEVYYTNEEDEFRPYHAGFFIDDSPAYIKFCQNQSDENLIGKYQLENVIDFNDEGAGRFKNFIEVEENDFISYYRANHQKFSGNDSLLSIAQKKADKLLNQKTEFIKQCNGSYYCFWKFRREVVYNNTIPESSLLTIYRNAFSDKFKQSFEGNEILKIINGRSESENKMAPNFKAFDINGKEVLLENFHGYFVIVNFWASWCSPCIKEFPAIKEIRSGFSEEKLKMIFITLDNDTVKFSKAIERHSIDFGIHLFSTIELVNLFGAQTIPKVILIDPKGMIIYNNQNEVDNNLLLLYNLLEKQLN